MKKLMLVLLAICTGYSLHGMSVRKKEDILSMMNHHSRRTKPCFNPKLLKDRFEKLLNSDFFKSQLSEESEQQREDREKQELIKALMLSTKVALALEAKMEKLKIQDAKDAALKKQELEEAADELGDFTGASKNPEAVEFAAFRNYPVDDKVYRTLLGLVLKSGNGKTRVDIF